MTCPATTISPLRSRHLVPGPDVRGCGCSCHQLFLLQLQCHPGFGGGFSVSSGPGWGVGVGTPGGTQPEHPTAPPGAVLVWAASGDATGAPRAASVCTGSTAQRAR